MISKGQIDMLDGVASLSLYDPETDATTAKVELDWVPDASRVVVSCSAFAPLVFELDLKDECIEAVVLNGIRFARTDEGWSTMVVGS